MNESLFPEPLSKRSETFRTNHISLFIPGVPQPKQSVRSRIVNVGDKSFVKHHQTSKVIEAERNIRAIVIPQLPTGFVPFSKGINVTKLHYSFPPLKSFSKKIIAKIDSGHEVVKTTKPDLTDNLNKGVFDALEGLVFINDSQICGLNNCKKFYSNTPGISLVMEELVTSI